MPVLVAEGWDGSRRGPAVSEGPSASPQETPSSHFTNGPHKRVQGPGLKRACLSVCKSNTPTIWLSSSPPLPVPFSASGECPPACVCVACTCVRAGLASSSHPPLVYPAPSFCGISPVSSWLFTCLCLWLRPCFHHSENTGALTAFEMLGRVC